MRWRGATQAAWVCPRCSSDKGFGNCHFDTLVLAEGWYSGLQARLPGGEFQLASKISVSLVRSCFLGVGFSVFIMKQLDSSDPSESLRLTSL